MASVKSIAPLMNFASPQVGPPFLQPQFNPRNPRRSPIGPRGGRVEPNRRGAVPPPAPAEGLPSVILAEGSEQKGFGQIGLNPSDKVRETRVAMTSCRDCNGSRWKKNGLLIIPPLKQRPESRGANTMTECRDSLHSTSQMHRNEVFFSWFELQGPRKPVSLIKSNDNVVPNNSSNDSHRNSQPSPQIPG